MRAGGLGTFLRVWRPSSQLGKMKRCVSRWSASYSSNEEGPGRGWVARDRRFCLHLGLKGVSLARCLRRSSHMTSSQPIILFSTCSQNCRSHTMEFRVSRLDCLEANNLSGFRFLLESSDRDCPCKNQFIVLCPIFNGKGGVHMTDLFSHVVNAENLLSWRGFGGKMWR